MMLHALVGIFIVLVFCALLGTWVAGQKHRPAGEGLALGLFLGLLGVVIEALLPTRQPPGEGR